MTFKDIDLLSNIDNLRTKLSDRKFLVQLAVILFCIVGVKFVWQSYTEAIETTEQEILSNLLQYEKESRIIKNSSEFKELNTRLNNFRDNLIKTRFITGSTPSLAETSFQAIIKKIANQNKINIRATRILPKYIKNGYNYLQININARAEIGDIKNFLIAVHQDKHFLFVKEMEIKTISRREKRFYYFNAQLIALTTA